MATDRGKPPPASAVMLYSTEQVKPLFKDLQLATITPDCSVPENKASTVKKQSEEDEQLVSDVLTCTCCHQTFQDRTEQVDHYKSDWHRYNLKQRLKGDEAVTEQRFEEITGDDLSSISGSDSESSDEDDRQDSCLSKLHEESLHSSFHGDGLGYRHPRIFFRNSDGELMSIYRCLLHARKNPPSDVAHLLTVTTSLPDTMKWAILMTAGGHFAGAVFEKDKMVVHKTFHRYVVRAKRGTAQSMRDQKGNAPHSAGASIRRYNEAALNQEIHDLLASWSDHLKQCSLIFVRAPSFNRVIFFGGKSPIFNKNDDRIRTMPFPTRRPTCKELQRVHTLLSSVECFGPESHLTNHILKSPKKSSDKQNDLRSEDKKLMKTKAEPKDSEPSLKATRMRQDDIPAAPPDNNDEPEQQDYVVGIQSEVVDLSQLREHECTKKTRKKKKKAKSKEDVELNICSSTVKEDDEEFGIEHHHYKLRNDLYTACKTGDVERLQVLLSTVDVDRHVEASTSIEEQLTEDSNEPLNPEDMCVLLNRPVGDRGRTLLHLVATEGHTDSVPMLMEAGADPAVKDRGGILPYNAATTKETRNAFRYFSTQYPDKYDYTQAQIPPPLDPEREQEKKAKEVERRKAQKKAKRERTKEKREEERAKVEEEREKQRYLNLSDREKRALAAERRLATQVTSTGGSVPVLSRCFQCAADITGKVPFEYMEFKFCSPKCLKMHRSKAAADKS